MAFGLKPVRMRDGSPYSGSVHRVYYNTAANLFVGDPVTIGGTADAATGTMSVVLATAGTGNPIYGVVVAIDPIRTDLSKQYIPSGTAGFVYVETNPNVVYQATEDDGSLVITDVGQNHNLVAGSGGSTSTGTSSWAIDSDSSAVTATLQVRLLGLAKIEGNLVGAASPYTIWEVCLNNSNAVPNTAGI